MKAKQVLILLDFTKQRLSQLVQDGTIRVVEINNSYSYNANDVLKYAEKRFKRRAERNINSSLNQFEFGNKEDAKDTLIKTLEDNRRIFLEFILSIEKEQLIEQMESQVAQITPEY